MTTEHVSVPRTSTKYELLELAQQLRGRAEFLTDLAQVKSPQLMNEAARHLETYASILNSDPVAYMLWRPMSGPARFTTDKNAAAYCATRGDTICTPLIPLPTQDASK